MSKKSLILTLALMTSVAQAQVNQNSGLTPAQEEAIDQAMQVRPLNTDLIVKFPQVPESELSQVTDYLPAPQLKAEQTTQPDGTTLLQVKDGSGGVAMDESGRMATAVIPAQEEVVTVNSEEEAAQHKGSWVLLILRDVLNNTSVGIGMTKVEHYETSIWWQQGLPYTMKLISPAGDLQFSLKAKSIGFLSRIKNRFVHALVQRTSINVGYFYYGSFSSDAQATSSGFDNPKTYPIYQWTGTGNTQGMYLSIQEELPAQFYVAAGVIRYKTQWKMYIHQANCAGTSYSCPKINETVNDADGAQTGAQIILGRHIGSHGAVEFKVTSDSDNNWSPNGFPPIWHNQAYTIEYRRRL